MYQTTHNDHIGKVHLDPIYWLEMEATAISPRSAPPGVRFPNPLLEVTFKLELENLTKHHPLTRKLCESTNTESSFPECSPNFSQVLEVNCDKLCCNISIMLQHDNQCPTWVYLRLLLQHFNNVAMYQTHHTHYSNSGNLLFHPLIVTLYGLVVNVSPQYMIHRVNVLLTLGLSVGFIYGGPTENTTDK